MPHKALDKKIDALKKYRRAIEINYSVKKIGIFGSFAQGRQTRKSDLDVLVEFSRPIGFFKFVALENFLTQVLKTQVDLVTKKALKQTVKKKILNDVIYVH